MTMGILVHLLGVGGLCGLVLACAISGPTPSPACPSPVVDRGGGWGEIGGPRAWLLYAPPYYAVSRGARRLWVRVDERFAAEAVTLVGRRAGGSEIEGFVQWARPIEPGDWAPGSGPPSDLGGVVFFAGLPLAEPGCWEIVIGTTEEEELGSAFIDVQPLPPESPSPAF
jgi:hypothetical protein